MDIDNYQELAHSMAIYPERGTQKLLAIVYCALGLTEEAGETAGKLKKLIRDEGGEMTDEIRERVKRELGDVLWYLSALSKELGFKMSDVAQTNIEKILDRRARGTLKGSGDDR